VKTFSSLLLIVWTISTASAGVVSAFKGSELYANYESEFISFSYLEQVNNTDKRSTRKKQASGALISQVFIKPAAKSNEELYTSFKDTLTANGYRVSAYTHADAKKIARDFLGQNKNHISIRNYIAKHEKYRQTQLKKIRNFTDHLIVATKQTNGKLVISTIAISESGYYLIDHLQSKLMESGTVSLTAADFQDGMSIHGKFLIYDIQFATNSAVIKATSKEAIQIIANYITANPKEKFYIVGHTDDTGDTEYNLLLSKKRALAVVSALKVLKVPETQIQAFGVGAYSPVSTNMTTEGRLKNRRVEVVKRYR
jgi:OmpA-OmpF porin, OOP family